MSDTEQNPETETPKTTPETPTETPTESTPENEAETPTDTAPEPTPLEQAQAEIADLKNENVRLMAEMENVRKRTQKELDDYKKFAVSPLAKDLFSVSDNLGRALSAITQEQRDTADDAIKNLIIGLDMVAQDFESAFGKHKITITTPKTGDKFDVATMQAMQEIETPDVEKGHIVQILQPAYIMHERLLRPAMVIVAK